MQISLTGEAVKILKGYDRTSTPHVLIGNLLGITYGALEKLLKNGEQKAGKKRLESAKIENKQKIAPKARDGANYRLHCDWSSSPKRGRV